MTEFTKHAEKAPDPAPNPATGFTKLAEATLNVRIGSPSGTPSGYPGSIVLSPEGSDHAWLALAGVGVGLAIAIAGGRKHV